MPQTTTQAVFPDASFVPADLDASTWEAIEPYYRDLLDREIDSKEDLERLLLDRSELDAAAYEAYANRYIAMTCATGDESIREAYLTFVREVSPRLEEIGHALDETIVNSPHAKELDAERYRVMLRDLKADVAIFREQNIPLSVKEKELGQRYGSIMGDMTVEYRGEERTLQQMSKFLEVTDRAIREEAWRLMAERRYRDHEALSALFDEMIEVRVTMAENAGFDDYVDYTFRRKHRFDYTPADTLEFHDAIEEHCVPLMRRMQEERKAALRVDRLRPWDGAVDAKGREPLEPFATPDELVEGSARVFRRMDEALGEYFETLRDGESLDLESRKGKRPGGYQAYRARRRKPFIFMNATGQQGDVNTMLHEAGHAFHTLLCRNEPLLHYRNYPIEFAEVASMSMELLSHPFLDEFYSEEEALRARREHLERVVNLFPWVATIDAFQQWIYTHPDHSHADREKAWLKLMDRFGGLTDWGGLEQHRATRWQQQGHLFSHPLYYVEYGIAMLGALQMWMRYRDDPKEAVERYRAALALGGTRPLPELFEAAGLRFDFGHETMKNAMAFVRDQLEALPDA